MKMGKNVKLWHKEYSNIGDCQIGDDCVVHSHVWIGDGVVIGNRVRIQAFTFIPFGVVIEDDVFLGPRVTFTNDSHMELDRGKWSMTIVKRGAKIGASSTIIAGVTIGIASFVGAGSVVTKDVPDGAIVYGVPAVVRGTTENYLYTM